MAQVKNLEDQNVRMIEQLQDQTVAWNSKINKYEVISKNSMAQTINLNRKSKRSFKNN